MGKQRQVAMPVGEGKPNPMRRVVELPEQMQ